MQIGPTAKPRCKDRAGKAQEVPGCGRERMGIKQVSVPVTVAARLKECRPAFSLGLNVRIATPGMCSKN